MRFNYLKIKNINSFHGEHTLSFNDLFKAGDLFAITGPTGSGKSTILASISLALYGNHYKTTLSSFDFVSTGFPEGRIELGFSVKGVDYQSVWECRTLKKNGEKRKNITPKRQLFKNNEAIDEKIEELISLDFNQFCKVVILNQGEFSKLLTSSFSERRKILEQIAQTDKLSELSKYWRYYISQLSEKIKSINLQLESSQTLTVDDIKNINFLVKSIEEKLPKSQKSYATIQALIHIFKDFILNEKQTRMTLSQREKTQQEIKTIHDEINIKKNTFKKTIELNELNLKELKRLRPKLDEYKTAQLTIKQANHLFQKTRDRVEINESQLARITTEILQQKEILLQTNNKTQNISNKILNIKDEAKNEFLQIKEALLLLEKKHVLIKQNLSQAEAKLQNLKYA